MAILILVALGGSIGAVARYLVAGAVQARAPGRYPLGTLSVNLAGALLLGILVSRLGLYGPTGVGGTGPGPAISPLARFVLTGVLGSFTTFSAFAFEVRALHVRGRPLAAAGYAGLSLVGGVVMVFVGVALASIA
jgi:fluoride exporter